MPIINEKLILPRMKKIKEFIIKKIIFCVDEKDEVSDFIESVQNGITERIDTLDLKKYTK